MGVSGSSQTRLQHAGTSSKLPLLGCCFLLTCPVDPNFALHSGLIQLAEMAWQQGLDLYSYQNSRLFTAMVRL
jgi:hypothetical protein